MHTPTTTERNRSMRGWLLLVQRRPGPTMTRAMGVAASQEYCSRRNTMPTTRVVEPDIDTLCQECGSGTEIVTLYMTGWDESDMTAVSKPTRQCANRACPSRK
jgi:hypothetical protein